MMINWPRSVIEPGPGIFLVVRLCPPTLRTGSCLPCKYSKSVSVFLSGRLVMYREMVAGLGCRDVTQ